MRKIILWFAGTVSGLIMLFSYHTSLGGTTTASPVTTGAGAQSSTSGPSSGSLSGGSATQVFTGATAQTRWGPVQVRIAVTHGAIAGITAVRFPSGNGRDQEINSYALPVLAREVLDLQSAHIDMVSGATVTSGGYIQSLQSAIDQANL